MVWALFVIAHFAWFKLVMSVWVVESSDFSDFNFVLIKYWTILSRIQTRLILLSDFLKHTTMWGSTQICVVWALAQLLGVIHIRIWTHTSPSNTCSRRLLPNRAYITMWILLWIHACFAHHVPGWVLSCISRSGQRPFDTDSFCVYNDSVRAHSLCNLGGVVVSMTHFAWSFVV